MKRSWKVLLAIVAVSCFAVALSYPIRYRMNDQKTEDARDRLIAMRDAAIESEQNLTEEIERPGAETDAPPAVRSTPEADEPEAAAKRAIAPEAEASRVSASEPDAAVPESADAAAQEAAPEPIVAIAPEGAPEPIAEVVREIEPAAEARTGGAAVPLASAPPEAAGESAAIEVTATPEPVPTPEPESTVDRYVRVGALAYSELEKRTLNEDEILPRYRMIYEINRDLVGWIAIPGTDIDYPVVQAEDSDYYLSHDFFGEENNNGQIILDANCDPYTPSYNLVISGHNMRTDKMFGTLDEYRDKRYWQEHKLVRFDTLMERKEYVVFAAFYSADYDVDETGFRYYTDIQYRIDADLWFEEIRKNQLYDSGIDVEFGDEFLTLTTCNRQRRKDGRFVVVCRRIRQGEEIT